MDIKQAENIATVAESLVSGAGGFLESVVAKALIVILVSAISAGLGYWIGREKTRAEYEGKFAQQANSILKLEQNLSRKTDQIVTQYVTKVQKVEVIKYVPSDPDLKLDGAFRVFYDYSASGILPATAGASDDSPVPITDLASTESANLSGCRKNYEQLISLQEWVKAVSK